MKISIIVAHGNNGEIGLNNELLWNISEDLKRFKSITNGHHIVMGRKTHESIGKVLPGRTNIVLSNSDFKDGSVVTVSDVESAIAYAKANGETELMVIGGEEIYKLFLPLTDKIYLSHVDYTGEADAYFPTIDYDKWDVGKRAYTYRYKDGPNSKPICSFRELTRKDKL